MPRARLALRVLPSDPTWEDLVNSGASPFVEFYVTLENAIEDLYTEGSYEPEDGDEIPVSVRCRYCDQYLETVSFDFEGYRAIEQGFVVNSIYPCADCQESGEESTPYWHCSRYASDSASDSSDEDTDPETGLDDSLCPSIEHILRIASDYDSQWRFSRGYSD